METRIRICCKSPSHAVEVCTFLASNGWYVEREGFWVKVSDDKPTASEFLIDLATDLKEFNL